jgi:hypothetical protein
MILKQRVPTSFLPYDLQKDVVPNDLEIIKQISWVRKWTEIKDYSHLTIEKGYRRQDYLVFHYTNGGRVVIGFILHE